MFPITLFLALDIKLRNVQKMALFKLLFESFYEGLNLLRRWQYSYTLIFYLRRTIIALVIIKLTDTPILQIFLIHMCSVLILAYLFLVKPFDNHLHNWIEIGNESVLILMADMLLPFVDESRSSQERMSLGWFYIIFLFFYCFVGISYSGFLAFGMIRAHLKF